MAIVLTKRFPGIVVNIHDDCLIKDEAEVQRRLNICAEIMGNALRRNAEQEAMAEEAKKSTKGQQFDVERENCLLDKNAQKAAV